MVKKFYKKNKENLQKEALERCQNLSVEEKKRKKWFRKSFRRRKRGKASISSGLK